MANGFDPDAFLRQTAPAQQPMTAPVDAGAAAPAFDPDAFLQSFAATPPRVSDAIPTQRRSYGVAEIPGAALSNLPESAKKFGMGLYEAVTSPIQTAKGIFDVAAGGLYNALPQGVVDWINKFDANPAATNRAVELANAAGGMLKERYGSVEGIKRTLAEDPVGAAADLSTLLSGGAMATTRLPAVSKTLSTAATMTDPLSLVTKPAQLAIEAKQKILPSDLMKEQQKNVVRDATLRAAQEEGYVVTPGSVVKSNKNIVAERIAGKTHLEQLASVQNQDVTNKLSRRALGLPENAPLTRDNMKQIRAEEYNKGYEPINKIGNIEVDGTYLDDLANIGAKYRGVEGSFPEAVPSQVGKIVDEHLVDRFSSADAVSKIRTLREQARAAFDRGDNDVGFTNSAIATALENQIERSLTAAKRPDAPKLLEQFRLSRQRMAISHTIEDAIKEGGGDVIASKLARDIQSGKYVSGDIKTIAEFANIFPRVAKLPSDIGTPGSGTVLGRSMMGLGAAGGAGAGWMLGGGGTGASIGAAAGALAPELVSAGLRNYLLSERAQGKAIPDYRTLAQRVASDEAARNALLAAQAQTYGQPQNRNNLMR